MASTAPHEVTQSRREALQAAAHWYARLCSEEAGPADEQALQQWLDSDPIHQWAWQRVDQLQVRLGRVPNHLALNTLERAEQHFSMSRRSVLKGLALMLGTGLGCGRLPPRPRGSYGLLIITRPQGQPNS